MNRWMTQIGTISMQLYLFVSNRLEENAGGAKLIEAAMNAWRNDPRCVCVGGGHVLLISGSKKEAIQAVEEWSREWLGRAPGLRFMAAHEEIIDGDCYAAYKKLREDTYPEREEIGPHGVELGALPVSATCPSTGLAAGVWDANTASWISEEAAAKRHCADEYHHANAEEYRKILEADYALPMDVEDFGIHEGASQIAIVHADASGMGEWLKKELERRLEGDFSEAHFRNALGELSENVSIAARNAAIRLVTAVRDKAKEWNDAGVVTMRKNRLPVRMIVDSGDDATWVCAGNIGIDSAAHYIRYFEEETEKLLGERLSVRAGVIILPHRFPFRRAYEMAEGLCRKTTDAYLAWDVITEGTTGENEARA